MKREMEVSFFKGRTLRKGYCYGTLGLEHFFSFYLFFLILFLFLFYFYFYFVLDNKEVHDHGHIVFHMM